MPSGMLELKAPSLGERLLRLIYPHKCMMCDCILREDAVLALCKACQMLLPRYSKGFEPFPDVPYLDGLFAAFHYEIGIDSAIQAMKFHHQPRISKSLGFLVCEELLKIHSLPDFDLILPVPLHPKKQKLRGYNQSELLGKELSVALKIPVDSSILIKTKKTKPQSQLKREERLKNLKDAYEVPDAEKVQNKVVLLVDDVVTTGTTLNTCAKILYENGAAWVYAAVIAIAGK